MDPNPHRTYGLRPTLRHLMILVLYGAALCAVFTSSFRQMPPTLKGVIELFSFSVFFSPLILWILFRLLDRPGPVRDWIVGVLISLFLPCMAIHFTLTIFVIRPGRHSMTFMIFTLLYVLFLTWYVLHHVVPTLWPSLCPTCGVRSLIPLKDRLRRIPPVPQQTRWCASCGSKYRRQPSGAWEEVTAEDPKGATGRS